MRVRKIGLARETMIVLEEENVLNMKVFVSLHFEKLLPKLTVGDHVVLWKLWDSKQGSTTSRDVHAHRTPLVYRLRGM